VNTSCLLDGRVKPVPVIEPAVDVASA